MFVVSFSSAFAFSAHLISNLHTLSFYFHSKQSKLMSDVVIISEINLKKVTSLRLKLIKINKDLSKRKS